jgi:ATP-dependent DNA helicase RecG
MDIKKKLLELCNLRSENEIVEFKEAKNDFDFNKLGRYYSALSNEANLKGEAYAWLVFGIEDKNHKTIGSNYRLDRTSLDRLKSEVANKTTNNVSFVEIHEVMTNEGRVILFQIPAAPHGIPIAWDGHFYGRNSEDLTPLNLEKIERIRRQATFSDWSAQICPHATIEDLDSVALKIAREKFKIKNPRLAHEVDGWDNHLFLTKSKLMFRGQLTRSAIILLGKPESEHLLTPAIARITWLLKDKEGIEKDYHHLTCPLILAVDEVFSKIRNLKYRYIKEESSLFPEEVEQYDSQNIRELLNNCIAHQDYSLGGRINVVESEDATLSFTNLAEFLPGSIENVINSEEPPEFYRNSNLVQAMVNFNMIDTAGSGIKRVFRFQRDRLFPMPDYELTDRKVKAVLTGKVLDLDYARVLARHKDLSLSEILMLDKVQKKKELTEEEVKHLRKKGLIEGRKPNYIIAESVAIKTKQVGAYLKNRGLDSGYYEKLLFEFIKRHKSGVNKNEIRELFQDKLPMHFSAAQKDTKISNLLRRLKGEKLVKNVGSDKRPCWVAI